MKTQKMMGLAVLAVALTGTTSIAQTLNKSVKVGKGLYEIVYSEKANAVYVAGVGARGQVAGAKVYKLDPKTLDVKDSIDVSAAPAYGLGLNDKTQILYTSNTRNNSVHAIDLKTGKILATISNGKEKSHTREVVVDEAANLIYVSDVGEASSIWVIDGKTNKFSHLIENTGKSTTGMALDAKNQQIYVTNMGTNEIAVIDLKTRKVSRSFPAGGESPTNLALDTKTNRLFVANQKTGDLTVLDAVKGTVLSTVKTGAGALGVSFNPVKNTVYVANRQGGSVTVVDAANYTVLADIKGGGTYPNTVTIDKKTGAAYVSNKAAGKRDDPAFVDPSGDTISMIQ